MSNNANSKFQNNIFLHFPVLESTNQYAIELVSKSNPTEGTVISTYNQPLGRGQIGSKWESAPNKNLSASIILYPNFISARSGFSLNQLISLAVYDFIGTYVDKAVCIKWPNDIYVGSKKIAGILIQNMIQGQQLQSSVVGIGVNINQENFSKGLINPTSLKLETGKEFELDSMLKNLFEKVEYYYFLHKSGDANTIKKKYSNALYKINLNNVFTRKDGTTFSGFIRSTTVDGKLQIENELGELFVFNLKEISYK